MDVADGGRRAAVYGGFFRADGGFDPLGAVQQGGGILGAGDQVPEIELPLMAEGVVRQVGGLEPLPAVVEVLAAGRVRIPGDLRGVFVGDVVAAVEIPLGGAFGALDLDFEEAALARAATPGGDGGAEDRLCAGPSTSKVA